MIRVTHTISIDDDEVDEQFVRASGPGGQNVNKVSTAVQLRFDVGRARMLTDEDVLVIDARSHRTQGQNREDARARLAEFIRQALVRPKRRHKTRPGAAAKQRRLDTKKIRAQTKQGRGRLRDDD